MKQISDDVRAFVCDNFLFGVEANTLEAESSLIEEGIIDSAGVLELVAFLEDTYDIEISDSELLLDNLETIARIARFVNRKLKQDGVAVRRLSTDWAQAMENEFAEI